MTVCIALWAVFGSVLSEVLYMKKYMSASPQEKPNFRKFSFLVVAFDLFLGVGFVWLFTTVENPLHPFLVVEIAASSPILAKILTSHGQP